MGGGYLPEIGRKNVSGDSWLSKKDDLILYFNICLEVSFTYNKMHPGAPGGITLNLFLF